MIVQSLISQSLSSLAASLLLLPLLYFAYTRLVKEPSIYDKLPWAGLEKGRFGRLKTKFSKTSRKAAIIETWKKYSSQGRAFVWQQFLGQPMIVLPPSQLRWLLDQPHDVLSSHDFFNDNLALETSLMDPKVHQHPIHIRVVHNQLNRALSWTPMYILDELSRCFDEFWGFSPDWHSEVVWSSFIKFVARTVNRMFVGEELCRNEELLDAAIDYAKIFITQGMMLRPVPHWMRVVIGVPMTIPVRRIFGRIMKHMGPVVEKRKADYSRKQADPTYDYKEPNDLLQWIIQGSYASPDPTDLDTARIVKRFMAINFAAIHTTTQNSTKLVVNLASADPKKNYIGQLRDQITEVYKECKGNWTKAHLVKLSLLDSALRETLRLGSGSWVPTRKVVAKQGLTLPDGLHVPCNAHLAIPSYGMHHPDESAFEYDAFRWAQQRSDMTKDEIVQERNLQATATGLEYLPFGHGRDACPGRFFAVQEIKLMMVHLFLNYEIRPLDTRPDPAWFADMPGAPVTTRVDVRKISPPILD